MAHLRCYPRFIYTVHMVPTDPGQQCMSPAHQGGAATAPFVMPAVLHTADERVRNGESPRYKMTLAYPLRSPTRCMRPWLSEPTSGHFRDSGGTQEDAVCEMKGDQHSHAQALTEAR